MGSPGKRSAQDRIADTISQSTVINAPSTTKFTDQRTVTIDAEQVFMLYATFCGDANRAAHAAGVTVPQVEKLVKDNHWDERIKGLIALRKSERAGDVERAINRAICFVQAHRYRIFLERVLRDLTSKSEEELYGLLVTDKLDKAGRVVGTTLSMKPLADLSTALEKVHYMTYLALMDSLPDRKTLANRAEESTLSETDIHARISSALTKMRAEEALEAAQSDPTAPPPVGDTTQVAQAPPAPPIPWPPSP